MGLGASCRSPQSWLVKADWQFWANELSRGLRIKDTRNWV